MNDVSEGRGRPPGGPLASETARPEVGPNPRDVSARSLERAQWRQLLLITGAAIAIYVTLRLLPTGTNLNHLDFRVQGKNSIEFCDPLNPQFIPVVAARSPVSMTVAVQSPPISNREVRGVLTLRTSGGKPIAPEDLLVVHTRPLHLMVVDPSLTDYQHVHPIPSGTVGEWSFAFIPRFAGTYRLFADFTPVATGRGLYANADLEVRRNSEVSDGNRGAGFSQPPDRRPPEAGPTNPRDGYGFSLISAQQPIRARQPIDFNFTIAGPNGAPVPLQPVMGAYAHLVAFDSARSGFAHLHPTQADPLQAPNPIHPLLNFKLTIPNAGRYVIWSQINLGGKDVFVPFWFDVVE